MPNIRNIIIFIVIGAILVLAYIFFLKPAPATPNLVSTSTSSSSTTSPTGTPEKDSPVDQDFLNLLLSVQSIKLKDAIFSDSAFLNLHDTSIPLTQDGTEGRVNPFAPLGTDPVTPPAPVTTPVTP